MKSAKSTGIRVGNWLSQRQAQALLTAPDISTVRGLRDRAILAVLPGHDQGLDLVAGLRTPRSPLDGSIILLGDQLPVPSQQRLRRHQRGDFFEKLLT